MNILLHPTPYINNVIERALLNKRINLFQHGASTEIAVE
jgi:hypothetical protein